MRDESEIKSKRDYWLGVYYALNPADRHSQDKSGKEWLVSEIWLSALDWSLGQATNTATTLRKHQEVGD